MKIKLPKSTWVFPDEVIEKAAKQIEDNVLEDLKKGIDEELESVLNERT